MREDGNKHYCFQYKFQHRRQRFHRDKHRKLCRRKKSPPPFDPMLDETERILLDYISLLDKKSQLLAN